MLLKRTRRNNPQFFYKNSYKEINLERKHFPFLTYHKTKRDLNDEHIRQIPFIIYRLKSIKNPVKTQKNGIPDRSRTTTFRLGGGRSIQLSYGNIFKIYSILVLNLLNVNRLCPKGGRYNIFLREYHQSSIL